MAKALEMLGEVPDGTPLILDGFLSGTLDPDGLARLRAPLCAMVHHPLGLESGLAPGRAAFLLSREKENLALMHRVLVPSPHVARTLATDFDVPTHRITIAPPGFAPAPTPRHEAAPPLILSVGILHPRKGQDVLLQSFSRITDLDWQAVIVGGIRDATYAAAVHARATRPDLLARVRVAGEVDEASLQDLYRSAALLAQATWYEGYGMVFGEAQRHGLPIVASRAGAVPDTVPDSAGVLVPPGDSAAFADALRCVLVDADLRRRLAEGSARAGSRLPTWRDTAEVVGTVLDGMVGE
jgi:glycosyltransferase involved in cell wall biosynthesis